MFAGDHPVSGFPSTKPHFEADQGGLFHHLGNVLLFSAFVSELNFSEATTLDIKDVKWMVECFIPTDWKEQPRNVDIRGKKYNVLCVFFHVMCIYFLTLPNVPCVSVSVTVCEPGAMSEAVAMESSSAGGILESSCAASLDDAIADTAK